MLLWHRHKYYNTCKKHKHHLTIFIIKNRCSSSGLESLMDSSSTEQQHKRRGLDLEKWPNAPEWAWASWCAFWDLEVRMHAVWMQDWSMRRAPPGHLHSQGSPWQRNLPQKQHQCPTVMSSLELPHVNKASACFYSSFPLFLGQDIGLKGGLIENFLCTFLPVDNILVTRKKTHVSSLVSCFVGHVERIPAV